MIEKRFIIIYNEDAKMMQYVDNQKEEPNRWAIWNASETAQKLNNLSEENEQLKQQIKDLQLGVLDSIHKANEIQCSCNPCVVEECVKKVVE